MQAAPVLPPSVSLTPGGQARCKLSPPPPRNKVCRMRQESPMGWAKESPPTCSETIRGNRKRITNAVGSRFQ